MAALSDLAGRSPDSSWCTDLVRYCHSLDAAAVAEALRLVSLACASQHTQLGVDDFQQLLHAVQRCLHAAKASIRTRAIYAAFRIAIRTTQDNVPTPVAREAVAALINVTQQYREKCMMSVVSAYRFLCSIATIFPVYLRTVCPSLLLLTTHSPTGTLLSRWNRNVCALGPSLRALVASEATASWKPQLQQLIQSMDLAAHSSRQQRRQGPSSPDSQAPPKRQKLIDKKARDPIFSKLLERLDSLQLDVSITLISKCFNNVSLPPFEPAEYLMEPTPALKKMISRLHEQTLMEEDPRLKDPRLRPTLMKQLSEDKAQGSVDADIALVAEALKDAALVLAEKSKPPEEIPTVVPPLPRVDLNEEQKQDMIAMCFSRMLSNSRPKGQHMMVLAANIARFGSAEIDKLALQHVLENPEERLEFSIQLTYGLFASSAERHDEYSLNLSQALLEHPSLLGRFFSDCAALRPKMFDFLNDNVTNMALRTGILGALRDIVLHRVHDRNRAMNMLLSYGEHQEKTLRTLAIGLMTNKLLPLPKFAPICKSRAICLLQSVLEMTQDSEQEVKHPLRQELEPDVKGEGHYQDAAVSKSEVSEAPSDAETDVNASQANAKTDANEDQTDAKTDPNEDQADEKTVATEDQADEKPAANEDQANAKTDANEDQEDATTDANGDQEDATQDHGETDEMNIDSQDDEKQRREKDEAEVNRRLEMFVAFCTRDPDMLRTLFETFVKAKPFIRQCIHKQMLNLVRTVGTQHPAILALLQSFPAGSDALALHMLHIVTDEHEVPGDAIVAAAMAAFESGEKHDARFLIPVITGMKREDLVRVLPRLVALPKQHLESALAVILRPESPVSPSELLVRLHLIAPTADHPLLRKAIEATQYCVFNRGVFHSKVLGVCMQQLVDRSPVPVLFVRTLIQALAAHPDLVEFGMFILGRLIAKRVWEQPQLWQGFIVCCGKFRPQSFPVLLQLPAPRLDELLQRQKDGKMRDQLAKFVRNSRVHIRRALLSVLGLRR